MSSQMEMLSNKFNSLLAQYKDTYNEFLNTVNSNDNSFKSVPDSAFIGVNNINTIQGSSVDNCMTSCASNESCSGATFDNLQKSCSLRTGTGNVINLPNQTAIIKQALYYSYQLQKMNDEMTSINTNMMALSNTKVGDYQQTQELNSQKAEILENNYKTLEEERVQISEIIRQYETLNTAYENGNINVTSNYYTFIMYLFIVILLVLLLFKYGLSDEQVGGGMSYSKFSPFIFGILGLIIIINAILKN
jgi:phage-related tail protein